MGVDPSTVYGRNIGVSLGFMDGYTCMTGIYTTEKSLSHLPGFSNRIYGDKEAVSEGSFNINSIVVEANKKIRMGELFGYNMDGCITQVKSILEGEVIKQIST